VCSPGVGQAPHIEALATTGGQRAAGDQCIALGAQLQRRPAGPDESQVRDDVRPRDAVRVDLAVAFGAIDRNQQ
jgi:hypothetical protein